MRYRVLATDYDGTLATAGAVDEPTIRALESLIATGRRLVMVTGRELPELKTVFPRLDLFEWIVAENGALLYRPSTKEEELIAEPPPERFVETLRQHNCHPMSVGKAIVATWEPHQPTVLETIRKLGLELQVIFNKGAVMVLPAGVNKASGLAAALKKMGLSPHNAVGVGDAENDHALLRLCEFSVAVSNALPALKETADWITPSDHGKGVSELIERMVANDLSDLEGRIKRHDLALGECDGAPAFFAPYGPGVLIAGPSASGKSTVATHIIESLAEHAYQFCLIDPEGDYENFGEAVVLGGPKAAPSVNEVLHVLEKPDASVVVSLTGMPIPSRPPFFLELLPHLLEMRARLGRPHWLVLDEAHHLMPAEWLPPSGMLPEHLQGVLLITVHPDLLAKVILESAGTLIALGAEAPHTLQRFAEAGLGRVPPWPGAPPDKGEFLLWTRGSSEPPRKLKAHPCKTERRRHRRKYAEGELAPDRSFYFRGPQNKLKLRAQNLMLFLQIADGVDDETWEFHRQEHAYSRWFRDCIKDERLADEAEKIENRPDLPPDEGRALIRAAVERDYTLAATAPLPVPGAK
jgi:HAD superfamily hydrolase (TIGR01484 family)